MFKKLLLSIAVMSLVTINAEAKSTQVFGGISLTEDSDYTYIGAVTALNSDLNKDGFLLHGLLVTGGYEYSRPGASNVDSDLFAGDIMLGYHKYFEENAFNADRLTFFVGLDYQNHDLSPNDPANKVNGAEAGFKTQLETYIKPTNETNLDIMASYSTAYDSYWLKTQLGCEALGVNVGPELAFLGSESYDQRRYGLFVNEIPLIDTLNLGVSAGYADSSRRGDDGMYGEIGISYSF